MTKDQKSHAGQIAIIGMSCLFPGSDGLERYWQNICSKSDLVTDPPANWGAGRYLNAVGENHITTARGGFLHDLYRFDPTEFRVMPSSIDGSEPDQFLALKIATGALADSGYLRADYDHSKTGIILGHSTYLHRGNAGVVQHGVVLDQTVELLHQLLPEADDALLADLRAALLKKMTAFNPDMAPGLVPNVMTGRIANKLDLKGPNYLIDAACASSLLAVRSAIGELRSGRSDIMLAGGVNASIPAEVYMVFTQLGALSEKGRARPFDAAGDGTVLGEGLGVVVLKRLEDAVADGDRVYAVIRGVGQSSDGRGAGLLAPRLEGEVLAIRRSFDDAGMPPGEGIGLIEAHGTGIPLGDRTEINALKDVFGGRKGGLPTVAIGSVKSMIGHCIPAAGVAGLIKTALALHYRTLPPTLCDTVRPENGIAETPLFVNTETTPWIKPLDTPRRAGVNAFGFGGINTLAVLEEAPAASAPPSSTAWPCELLLLSAKTTPELAQKAQDLRRALAEHPDARLSGIAAALAQSAGDGPCRLAIVASGVSEFDNKLGKAITRLNDGRGKFQMRSGVFATDRPLAGKLAFVFPGEGAQYQRMLDDVLIAFPEARQWFDFWDGVYAGDRAIAPSTSVFPPTSTLEPAMEKTLEKMLFGLEVGSESVFVASQALLAVTRRLGLAPDVMVGHSSGEHSALRASGVIGSDHDDWHELKQRILDLNRLYKKMDEVGSGAVDGGALLTVGAIPRARILEICEADDTYLALDNCQHQSVLYGTRAHMEEVAASLRAEGGLCAFLPFDRPYHTDLFAPVAKMVAGVYSGMDFRAPRLPLYSCATAAQMPGDAIEIKRLAAHQWRARVRFTETIQQMYDDGVRLFVEVGPSANLTGFIDDILKGSDALALALDSRRRPSLSCLLQTLGRVWLSGRAMDPGALFTGREIEPVDLGTAPKPRRDRVVDNTLPFARLSEDEAAPLRARLAALRSGQADSDAPAAASDAATAEPAMNDHFALMQQFLDVEEKVLVSGLGNDAAAGALPLHFLHRIVSEDRDHLIAECDIDIETDRFLRDHVLYSTDISDLDPARVGLPVVPLAVSIEMLAEAAAALCPDLAVLRLENVRTFDWVLIEAGFDTLTIEARRLPAGAGAGEDRFAARVLRGETALLEAEVVLGAPREGGEDVGLAPLSAPRAPVWKDDELYTSGMFHGPLFHSIASLSAWDEGGLDAIMAPTPLDDFSADMPNAALILNPALLDAIGHVTAFWIAQGMGTDFSSFPSSIERIDLYDARREDTAGFVIGGRLAFADGDTGGARFLSGDFTCTDPEGRPVFAARGWRDRFFDVPHNFFHARYKPRDGWYGVEQTALFATLPDTALVWSVPAFPKGFLTDAGGIWQRVLTHTVLSPRERDEFLALPPRNTRREEWLVGRIALKEAARAWLSRHCGVLLMPSDVEISVSPDGKPFVDGAKLIALGPMPEVSLSHSRGEALAIAAAPGQPVGIDMEQIGRVPVSDLLAGAFSQAEQSIVMSGERPDESAMRGWCAKEAAAKFIGVGITARPRRFELKTLDLARDTANVDAPEQQGIRISLGKRGEMILAVAF